MSIDFMGYVLETITDNMNETYPCWVWPEAFEKAMEENDPRASVNLANGNAYNVLSVMQLGTDSCGCVPIEDFITNLHLLNETELSHYGSRLYDLAIFAKECGSTHVGWG